MPQAPYRLAFDIAGQPSDPMILWIEVAGAVLALIVLALGVRIVRGYRGMQPRAGRMTWFVTLFATLSSAAFLFGSLHQHARERALDAELAAGRVRTEEGCLDHFVPEQRSRALSTSTATDAHWRVGGQEFRYGSGDMGRAFKTSAGDDGPVRADSRVKLRYIVDPLTGMNRIVRLEVADGACPPAPARADFRRALPIRNRNCSTWRSRPGIEAA
ncbi:MULTISPECIES: hypothetical protein [unclassified Sphingomonas]|uniref:hypothetical protein n=1 Tax=unclassified Sphingomonas TaxID=196159 RepID=UPI0008349630|nr:MULTISPECIES: hypothetical protein [unclassified Sphingomonas]